MRKRIFLSIFATALIAVLLVGSFTAYRLYGEFDARTADELQTETESAARALETLPDANDFLAALGKKRRITLIDADGTVTFDNSAPNETSENHLSRPEVNAAVQTGYGESYRYSTTLTEKTHYAAQRLRDGRIVRLAVTRSSIVGLVNRFLLPMSVALLLIALLAFFLSRTLARRIVTPIGKIDPAEPLRLDAYEELSPLLLRLQNQNDALRTQIAETNRRRHEQAAIIENMSEGLLMLSDNATILSLNKSAARIFAVNAEKSIGQSPLTLNRSAEFARVIDEAYNGRSGSEQMTLNGRIYRLFSAPIAGPKPAGSVVLLLDVTERERAEKERREFSANVSHELRTPLTTIAGYSEIMSNGLVKPDDMKPFAAKIHAESQRLIGLVNDIIELSRLDEKADLPAFDEVDLHDLCENIMGRLRDAAAAKNVLITLVGDHIKVRGAARLLDEMVFNLIENAVKYNKNGGSVEISLRANNSGRYLTLQDTGLGIPAEHLPRIFERFYRVDKSHSRATGGTGLGLAIVKHVAELHGATVEVQSMPDKGSCFTVSFPAKDE